MATTTKASQAGVVRSIEARVELLIEDHKKLRQQNSELKTQRDALRADKRALLEKIALLESDLATQELTAGLTTSTKSNGRAVAYINRLMREVDACLTLLNSPGAE